MMTKEAWIEEGYKLGIIEEVDIDEEKLAKWIKNGAKPTDSVKMLIEKK